MAARLMTAVVWAVVAAAAAYWGLQLFIRGPAAPAHALAAPQAVPAAADWSRIFGIEVQPVVAAEPPPPPPDTRFQLLGVVAPRQAAGGLGVALIAVDGKPPKAYRVGSAVDGDTVLQSVQTRGANLGPRGGPARAILQLPPVSAVGAAAAPGPDGNAAPMSPPPDMPPPGNVRPPRMPGRIGAGVVPTPSAAVELAAPAGESEQSGDAARVLPSLQGARAATR
jgi:general secretion pathway protein C